VASHSALTEEGRTRIRNFQARVNSYLLLWVAVSIGVTVVVFWLRTRYGYQPLQRLYLAQYIKSSLKSFFPANHQSAYTLLVRVVTDAATGVDHKIPCTDDEVTPVRDASGKVRFDPRLGPFFRLRDDIHQKYFYWEVAQYGDRAIYHWFRDRIYQGRSPIPLYLPCLIPLPIVLLIGMIISVKLDVRINREYEEGSLMRGIRLLKPSEYAREMKSIEGLGLPVFRPERSRR
jgi:hypothetical protein